jgi:hypothetical protein
VSTLASLETEFQGFLLTGSSAIATRVVGTERVPIATRLAIYGNAYRARLAETLEAHYPALLALLGSSAFNNLCSAYIDAHDSEFPSIRYYGGDLAALLESDADYAAMPHLAELARFEWAMTEVFDAADAVPLAVRSLAEVAPEDWARLAFAVHPALRRLDLYWNAPPLWKALTGEGACPEIACAAAPVAWLLWRAELQIYFRPLASAEAAALDAVRAGSSFGEVCVRLCAPYGEAAAPAHAAGYLREWVESGMIVGTQAAQE